MNEKRRGNVFPFLEYTDYTLCYETIMFGRVILRLNENRHSYPFYCVSFILELSVMIILRYLCSTPLIFSWERGGALDVKNPDPYYFTVFTFSPKGLHHFQKRTCTVLISFIGTLPEEEYFNA